MTDSEIDARRARLAREGEVSTSAVEVFAVVLALLVAGVMLFGAPEDRSPAPQTTAAAGATALAANLGDTP